MLNKFLNTLFLNVRTLVAGGLANAIRLGISDALSMTADATALELTGQPEQLDQIELEQLRLSDLTIE
ncbi:MAG: hypothetical protein R3C49_19735 [Planctomycetaceae bacterium]